MAKNTSFVLGERFDALIAAQVESGRYGNATEVVREAMRLLERREQRRAELARYLQEGEESGIAGTHEEVWARLHAKFPWMATK